MPHAIWKGSIRFGLVHIPVGLYSAETPDELDLDLIDKRNHGPIGYNKINKETGKQVAPGDIVKGYAISKSKYVVVTDQDLKRAHPEATQNVDIVGFVTAAEVAPIYFDKPYYLAPTGAGDKAYALLREALADTERVGIAQVVIRTRQYVAAMYPHGKVLVLHLLRYHHELREAGALDLPGKGGVAAKELAMAKRLIADMEEPFKPAAFRDEYRDKLLALIKAKAKKGDAFEAAEPEPAEETQGAEVVDLMALLKSSVEGKGKAKGTAPARRRRATAARPSRRTASARRKSA